MKVQELQGKFHPILNWQFMTPAMKYEPNRKANLDFVVSIQNKILNLLLFDKYFF